MKTMNKKITGIAAAVSLLTVMAGSVYAVDVCCPLGTVVEAGSVYHNYAADPGGFTVATSHGATLTCDTPVTGWDGTARTFELPGTLKDGMLATALTALADDKKVKFCLMDVNLPAAAPSGNVKGHVRSIFVTTTPTP